MKKHNYLIIILLGVSLSNCVGVKKEDDSLFIFETRSINKQYVPEDSINLSLLNPSSKEVDSVVYYINEQKIGTKKGLGKLSFQFKDQKLGNQNLKAIVYFEGELAETTSQVELVSSVVPKLLKYTIVNTYPHDVQAYTQGLEFYRDTLFEGTGNGSSISGNKGISSLRKTNFKTGEVYKKIELAEQYFGEGITILNNKIYQLTWLNNEGYVYNVDTFKKEKTIPYFKKMEGWGLTTDGKSLYMTDSSETIHILNPDTFAEIGSINVYSLSNKVKAVNELEWIEGKIYGNVYQKDAIAVINPKNGAVEGIINLADLKTKIRRTESTDVLNGIAYKSKSKTIFVTGKNWDTMFEIKIIK